jgi:hypothetical protein
VLVLRVSRFEQIEQLVASDINGRISDTKRQTNNLSARERIKKQNQQLKTINRVYTSICTIINRDWNNGSDLPKVSGLLSRGCRDSHDSGAGRVVPDRGGTHEKAAKKPDIEGTVEEYPEPDRLESEQPATTEPKQQP